MVPTGSDHFSHLRTQATKKCATQKVKIGFLQSLLCDRGGMCNDLAMIELMKRCIKGKNMMTNQNS